jgi:hypothetical protein
MDATFSALVRDDAVATVGRSSVTAQKKCWRGRRRFPSSSSALIARPTAVDLNGRSCFHRGKRTPTRSDRRACGSAFVACRRPGRLNNWFTATGTIAEGSTKFAASTPSVAGEARTDWASFQECPLSRRSSLSSPRHVVPSSRDELDVGGRGSRSVRPVVFGSGRRSSPPAAWPSRCG